MTSDIQLIATLGVTLSRIVDSGNWPAASQGADQIQARLAGVDLSVWNDAYIAKIPLAGSGGTSTIDLRNWTSLLFETGKVLSKVFGFAIQVTPVDPANTNIAVAIAPGASNGFAAMFTAFTLKSGESDFRTCAVGETVGYATDATHKTIAFTNSGSHDCVVTIIILGGN